VTDNDPTNSSRPPAPASLGSPGSLQPTSPAAQPASTVEPSDRPEVKQLMQELSEGLAPGEDPLFYKVEEAQEPESEPPSDARKEHHGPVKPRRGRHITIEVDKVKIADSARDPSRIRNTMKAKGVAGPPSSADQDVFKKLPPEPAEPTEPPSSGSPWSERAAPLPKEALPSSGAPTAIPLEQTAASPGTSIEPSGGGRAVWLGAAAAVVAIGGAVLVWSQMGGEPTTETTTATSGASASPSSAASPATAADPATATDPATGADPATAAGTASATSEATASSAPTVATTAAATSRSSKPAAVTTTRPATTKPKTTTTPKPKTTSEYIPGPTF